MIIIIKYAVFLLKEIAKNKNVTKHKRQFYYIINIPIT